MTTTLKPSRTAETRSASEGAQATGWKWRFLVGCALSSFLVFPPAFAQDQLKTPSLSPASVADAVNAAGATLRHANFQQVPASVSARDLANWVVRSADNGPLPFLVIDKNDARVFAFDASGQLVGATPALLGVAVGDHTVPGIGERKLSSILPHERTTPAGRFVAYLDRDIHGEEVLWVDYESALSLHRVVKGQPKERRAERLASPSPADNRITFGCINVSVPFYEGVVSPLFKGTQGIVYILPETRPVEVVFASLRSRAQPVQPVQPLQPLQAMQPAQPTTQLVNLPATRLKETVSTDENAPAQ